jgi:hydroxyacylglutathione hydrolase
LSHVYCSVISSNFKPLSTKLNHSTGGYYKMMGQLTSQWYAKLKSYKPSRKTIQLLADTPEYLVEVFPVGPLQCNCTLIVHKPSRQATIIDAGGDEQWLLHRLFIVHGVENLVQVWHSHAHFDHFMASEALRQATQATLHLNKADAPLWEMLPVQCERYNIPLPAEKTAPPDAWLTEGQPLIFGSSDGGTSPPAVGKCLHTPGHTPGSSCVHLPSLNILVAGDTLFKGSIGRTDLWGGSEKQIVQSVKHRLLKLDAPEDMAVVTGHGSLTTLGFEQQHNILVR